MKPSYYQTIKSAIAESPLSMQGAAAVLGWPFGTFVYRAKKCGLYNPNPSHEGRKLPNKGAAKRINLSDILNGTVIYHSSSRLKERLFEAGIKERKCESCGILDRWNGKKLTMHLDHIDGDNTNNTLDNLRILCPNCHSQTPTYARKKSKRNIRDITSCDVERVLVQHPNITASDLARILNLNHKSSVVVKTLERIQSEIQNTWYELVQKKGADIREIHPSISSHRIWKNPKLSMLSCCHVHRFNGKYPNWPRSCQWNTKAGIERDPIRMLDNWQSR